MFSGGLFEIGGLLFIAFLLFGPKKVPEIARTLGKGLGELRRASNELKNSLEEEIKNLDRYQDTTSASQSYREEETKNSDRYEATPSVSEPTPTYGHNDSEPTPEEPGPRS